MISTVVDAANVAWQQGETEGLTFRCQVLLDGQGRRTGGTPFPVRPDAVGVCPHAPDVPVPVVARGIDGHAEGKDGSSAFGRALHRPQRPVRPVRGGPDHDMLVLHPKAGGLMTMGDERARRAINLAGRLIVGADHTEEWLDIKGSGGARMKSLIPPDLGPEVGVVDLPPHAELALGPAPFGRYEVVLDGSVEADGIELGPPGIRYGETLDPLPPLVAGTNGARVAVLSFDADALEGGLTGEGLALTAAEAMAQAI